MYDSSMRLLLLLAASGSAWAVGLSAFAQDLVITQTEFATWPQYCQARYVTVPPGNATEYVRSVPSSQVTESKRLLGDATFERVHHYCYGLIWLARARFEQDTPQKAFSLRQAKDEVLFASRGYPPDSPMIAPSYVVLAQVCIEGRQMDCALDNLNRAITIRPDDALPYSALAVVYRNQKRLDLARDTLVKGNEATGGKSAEINYNLALIYLELGDDVPALEHAHLAYSLGHPLPGLRNRLQRLGKWTDPIPQASTATQ